MNTATITDSSAAITLDGVTTTHTADSLAQARIKVIEAVRSAPDVSYPLTITVTEPDGRKCLTLNADGTVTVGEPPLDDVAPAASADDDAEAFPPVEDDPDDAPTAADTGAHEAASAQATRPAASATDFPVGNGQAPADDAAPIVDAGPLPTATDFHTSKPPAKEAPAESGWRGLLNALGLRLAPSEAERAERADTAAVQRGVSAHKTVMVANLKGGAGKTTFTYLLAAVLGRVRGGTVLAWDNNENRGTLGHRSPIEPNTRATAVDLLDSIGDFEGGNTSGDLVGYVRSQGPNKFDLLASQNQGGTRPVIDGAGFERLHAVLANYYRFLIVDTGNASNASTWQATAAAADQIVVVCENAEDSAQTGADTIDLLLAAGYADKIKNSVAVVMDCRRGENAQKRREDAARLERIVAHFSKHMRAVHVLPWEPTLDAGAWIDWASLSSTMRRAMLATGASVVSGM